MQVYYAVADGTSELARLRRLAFLLLHWSRPLGAARLGLGTGLKGNGMALRWEGASAGLGSEGIVEDAAMTLALAARGVAVAFEPSATVWGYMAPTYAAARTQDGRWERGRFGLLLPAARASLHAVSRGRPRSAAAAVELASPPLSLLVLAALVASAALGSAVLWVALAAAGTLVSYVSVGLLAARAPLADVAALRFAPRFIEHKLVVLVTVASGRATTSWRRTERTEQTDA